MKTVLLNAVGPTVTFFLLARVMRQRCLCWSHTHMIPVSCYLQVMMATFSYGTLYEAQRLITTLTWCSIPVLLHTACKNLVYEINKFTFMVHVKIRADLRCPLQGLVASAVTRLYCKGIVFAGGFFFLTSAYKCFFWASDLI